MKLNKVIMVVALPGFVSILSAVAGPNSGTQEATADEKPLEQASVQKEVTQADPAQGASAAANGKAASFPDYEIGLFSHKTHVSGAGLQCTACHTGIFQMSAGTAKANGDFDKISFGEGKYCGACHNGSAAFTVQDEANCQRCHGHDVNPPDTMMLTKPVKGVFFDHALHNNELGIACNECHMKLFEMKLDSTAENQSDFNMKAMEGGKYCGACHNGTLAFGVKADCTKCHVDAPGYKRVNAGSGEKKADKQGPGH